MTSSSDKSDNLASTLFDVRNESDLSNTDKVNPSESIWSDKLNEELDVKVEVRSINQIKSSMAGIRFVNYRFVCKFRKENPKLLIKSGFCLKFQVYKRIN